MDQLRSIEETSTLQLCERDQKYILRIFGDCDELELTTEDALFITEALRVLDTKDWSSSVPNSFLLFIRRFQGKELHNIDTEFELRKGTAGHVFSSLLGRLSRTVSKKEARAALELALHRGVLASTISDPEQLQLFDVRYHDTTKPSMALQLSATTTKCIGYGNVK